MMKPCNECHEQRPLKHGLCEECYESFFDGYIGTHEQEDEGFVLQHHTAEVKEISSTIYTTSVMNHTIQVPKAYQVDFNKELNDADLRLLIMSVLSEVTFFDNHKYFGLIRHLLKEVK
jgi:hypothetical protein